MINANTIYHKTETKKSMEKSAYLVHIFLVCSDITPHVWNMEKKKLATKK